MPSCGRRQASPAGARLRLFGEAADAVAGADAVYGYLDVYGPGNGVRHQAARLRRVSGNVR